MSSTFVEIPPADAVLIARISRILAWRLVHGSDSPDRRQSLFRALFGLQRLPQIYPNLNLSISGGYCQLVLNSEHAGFVSYTDDGHTEFRIEWFPGSSHCIRGYEHLEGAERIEVATYRIDDFEAAMQEPAGPVIEDCSVTGQVDEPPIDAYLDYARTYDES